MLYVSRRDGTSVAYDLRRGDDRRRFAVDARATGLPAIRAVSLAANGARADLPVPRRLTVVGYAARLDLDRAGEPVAEVVSAVCDGVVASLTMYLNGASGRFRLDVDRRGTPRFRPT